MTVEDLKETYIENSRLYFAFSTLPQLFLTAPDMYVCYTKDEKSLLSSWNKYFGLYSYYAWCVEKLQTSPKFYLPCSGNGSWNRLRNEMMSSFWCFRMDGYRSQRNDSPWGYRSSGRFRGRPPHGPKFSQFHAVFRKIWQNHMLATPLEGWRPLLRGILDPPLRSYGVGGWQHISCKKCM